MPKHCILNIGTSFRNIQGVVFNKDFDEITSRDVIDFVNKHFQNETKKGKKINIHGWCDVTNLLYIENVMLTDMHKGSEVVYIPEYADGNIEHPDCLKGTILTWNEKYVFVEVAKETTRAIRPKYLVWS